MIKIIKYLKSRFTDVKKCYKTKQAVALFIVFMVAGRSEERRVGKECM